MQVSATAQTAATTWRLELHPDAYFSCMGCVSGKQFLAKYSSELVIDHHIDARSVTMHLLL